MKRRAQLAIEAELDFRFAHRAEQPLGLAPVMEHDQSRNRPDAVALGDARVLIDIDFHHPRAGPPPPPPAARAPGRARTTTPRNPPAPGDRTGAPSPRNRSR